MLENIQFPGYPFPTPPSGKLHCMKKRKTSEQIWLYHPKRTEGLLLSLFWAKYPVNVI